VFDDLRSPNDTKIEKRHLNYGFVRFVMTDEFSALAIFSLIFLMAFILLYIKFGLHR